LEGEQQQRSEPPADTASKVRPFSPTQSNEAAASGDPAPGAAGELCPASSTPSTAASTAPSDQAPDRAGKKSQASPTLPDEAKPELISKFRVGDPICVFRRSTGTWSRDGIIVKLLAESAIVDGLPMPAGSVKVLYCHCSSAKWVPPAAFGAELKQADYMVGDAVTVLCRSIGLWAMDGLVVEVLAESATVDGGLVMPAGSVKVIYASRSTAKWVPPSLFGMELRAQRPWSAFNAGEREEICSMSADTTKVTPVVGSSTSTATSDVNRKLDCKLATPQPTAAPQVQASDSARVANTHVAPATAPSKHMPDTAAEVPREKTSGGVPPPFVGSPTPTATSDVNRKLDCKLATPQPAAAPRVQASDSARVANTHTALATAPSKHMPDTAAEVPREKSSGGVCAEDDGSVSVVPHRSQRRSSQVGPDIQMPSRAAMAARTSLTSDAAGKFPSERVVPSHTCAEPIAGATAPPVEQTSGMCAASTESATELAPDLVGEQSPASLTPNTEDELPKNSEPQPLAASQTCGAVSSSKTAALSSEQAPKSAGVPDTRPDSTIAPKEQGLDTVGELSRAQSNAATTAPSDAAPEIVGEVPIIEASGLAAESPTLVELIPELTAPPAEHAPHSTPASDTCKPCVVAPSAPASDMVGEVGPASPTPSSAVRSCPSLEVPVETHTSEEPIPDCGDCGVGSQDDVLEMASANKLCAASATASPDPTSDRSGESQPASLTLGITDFTASSDPNQDTPDEVCSTARESIIDPTSEEIIKFCAGDPICVFRRSYCMWSRDGIVVKVLAEAAVADGLPMPAGSVKVIYDNRTYAKWIPPAEFGAEVKHADFVVGDVVTMLLPGSGVWVTDGLVEEVLLESTLVDGGLDMPVGSVKVTCSNGDSVRWIRPEAFSEELKAQRQWSDEDMEEQSEKADPNEAGPKAVVEPSEPSVARQVAGGLVRRLSRLLPPIMVLLGGSDVEDDEEEEDDDAFIISGILGLPRNIPGRYRRVGELNWKPKYQNERGAVIFFDEYWKMNTKDDTMHWCYEVREADGEQPPAQTWSAYHLFHGSNSVPTLEKAEDVEMIIVSGITGPRRAVNGRYAEVGWHNSRPKFKNRKGAIIFFDDYWKLNNRDDVLAWQFGVKEAVGSDPPAGQWEAHWSCGDDQPPASILVRGALAAAAS